MEWTLVIREGVTIGLLASVVLTAMVIVSLKINKEMWLQDYPPDVKAKWGPMSPRARRQRLLFAIPFFGVMIAALVATVLRLDGASAGSASFLEVFVAEVIVFVVFNVFDAVIIDWLILMVLWPGLGVLPGTEGMAGYRDVRLWTINLLKGFALAPIVAVLAAGVSSLLPR